LAAVETVRPGGDRVANTTHDLYRQYGRQIYAYCFHKLRSREEAEDAVQTTFMNAFRALQRGTATQFEQAWLYKIAQNVCFERSSSSSRRRLHEVTNDFDTLQEIVPAREGEGSLELIGIEEALEGMPENQRRAILLREWQGLSYREISDELGLSQAAVEMLIFRARRALAGALEKPDETRARRRKVGRGVTVGGLLSALKTLFGGGAAIKAVAAAAAAVVVVGESAQYTVVHQTKPRGRASSLGATALSAATKQHVATHTAPVVSAHAAATTPDRVEPSVVRTPFEAHVAPTAPARIASPARARHAVSNHVGTAAPKPDVEQTPAPAPLAPAAPPTPRVEAPPVHPATPAPPVVKAAQAVAVKPAPAPVPTPAATVPTVTLPTLADTPAPAVDQPANNGNGNGNAYGRTDDHGNGNGNGNAPAPAPTPVTTVETAPVAAPAPVEHGNGHGNGHGKP
jgi:RNA polymerase sigma factor (sigma-70 family)